MLNRPNTLDHYFDKSQYPEFSVYIPNLVPCCSECNSLKSTTSFDKNGVRQTIHFYHDKIPEKCFLFVRLIYSTASDPAPVINIYLSSDDNSRFSNLVKNHVTLLELIPKYKHEITARLAPVMDELKLAYDSGIPEETIIQLLETRRLSSAKFYGMNYWETAMYEGIINSPGFLHKHLVSPIAEYQT